MTFDINESNPNELWITHHGSKLKSLFFMIMGFLFQVLFVWAYWSFLDASGPWAFFWLGLINSDLFPFTSLLFLFGGGCFLIAIKEGMWTESWIIKKELSLKTPGIQKQWQLFQWSRMKTISRNQIRSLRIHIIPLDTLKLFNRYQLEVDYQLSDDSPLETSILYSDETRLAGARTNQLAKKIQETLNLSERIDMKEAPRPTQSNNKKRRMG
ncbi:MAG: hypothetical protein JSW11_15350 [Candidatus Heimdallarchaeota archaeon]|nr:MAG: hypothetical protein JSW11_15350 [Candidatus Heimdallarchaeota archaeon]